MFATALIVFREVLEAALVVGIVSAATRGVARGGRWIVTGIALGLAGSVAVAAGAGEISRFASGVGQELFNAAVLGLAVAMLAWHNIWMSAHGRALAAEARGVGQAIREGRRACHVLMLVVGLAVLREGAETVLFLWGVASSGGDAPSMVLGGAMGVAGGIGVGFALHAGLLRIPLRWFFGATATLVLLLAAGMAAQAAGFLVQADLLPSLGSPLWDTSALITDTSVAGNLLHVIAGYDARPAGIQVIAYVMVLTMIGLGMRWTTRRAPPAA